MKHQEFRMAHYATFQPPLRGPGFEDESITDWKRRWVTRMSSLQTRTCMVHEFGHYNSEWKDVDEVVIPASEWYKEV